jgi:hypothetical protein
MDRELATFFSEFFGRDLDSESLKGVTFPTFEEALGILELASARDENFKGFENSSMGAPSRLTSTRNYLIMLIAATLDRALQDEGKVHRKLIDNLRRSKLLKQCTFISFNYDILADNALLGLRDPHDIDLDYGLEFQNFSRRGNWQRPRPGKSIQLLKLHGSLNWLFCPSCRGLTLTPKDKGVCKLITDPSTCNCFACKTLSVPIIIPPTYFKVLSNIHLQLAWNHAEQALGRANTWIFCGYSFPDADIHVKYMLKRAEMNWPKDRRLVVFNGHRGKEPQQKVDEEARFRRFFGARTKIQFEKKSFDQFASDASNLCRA